MPAQNETLRYPLDAFNPSGTEAHPQFGDGYDRTLSWVIFKQKKITVTISGDGAIQNSGPKEVGRVELYLPGGTEVTDSINYNETNLDAIGKFIQTGLKKRDTAIGREVKAGAKTGLNAIGKGFDTLFGGEVSTSSIATILSFAKIVNGGAAAGVSSGIRAVANPHTQSVFNGVGIREFTFTFSFVPESKEEADSVVKIIQFFRKAAYPSFNLPEGDLRDRSNTTDSNFPVEIPFENQLAYIFPNVFEIETIRYDAQRKAWDRSLGHRYLLSHLTSVNTNYDPNQTMVIRPDGRYAEYSMALTFQEERTLTSHDIDQGY